MTIKKIEIKEFGGLRDVCVEPAPGVNLILGRNESGKSTLMAFISFIFYGLPPRRSAADREASDRALSWTGGKAEGSLEFEYNGSEYRIERSASLTGGRDAVIDRTTVVDLATGIPVYEGKKPCDIFLGVSQPVFESVTSVKQLGVGDLAGHDLDSAVENMLFSADETVSTEKALKKLNAARVQLQPLRGNGGRIEELERGRDILRDRLVKAEQNSAMIISLRATVEKYRRVTSDLRHRVDTARNICSAYESYQVLNRFDLLHAGERRVSALRGEEAELIRKKGTDGRLPDREYVSKLDGLSRRLSKSDSELSLAEAELRLFRSSAPGDSGKAVRAEAIEKAGGAKAVAAAYAGGMRKKRGRILAGTLLALFGIAAAVLSMLICLTPLIPFGWLKSRPAVSYIITAAGLLLAVAGVSVILSSPKLGKKAAMILRQEGYAPTGRVKDDCEGFIEYAENCAKEKASLDGWRETLDGMLTALDAKKSLNDGIRNECAAALAEFGFDGGASDAGLCDRLLSAASEASEIALRHEVLLSDIGKYSDSVKATADSLSPFNENELRARLSSEMLDALKAANPSVLTSERSRLEAQLDSASSKLGESEKNLGIAEHSYENPAKLAIELEAADAELDSARRLYAAILLAHKSISEAGDALRKNVTPRIRKRAGEILSELTGGKYGEIGVGTDFSVTVATSAGTKSIALLSGGTRDIAYFSLRLALTEVIFPGPSVPPLLLDEAASQLDDVRAENLLRALGVFAGRGVQSLFFSCHTREASISDAAGIGYNLITLGQ